jgi:hypothetical protein
MDRIDPGPALDTSLDAGAKSQPMNSTTQTGKTPADAKSDDKPGALPEICSTRA